MMKVTTYLLLLIITLIILFTKCEKGQNDIYDEENRIEFDGEKYPLDWGIIYYFGERDGLHKFELLLYPSSIDYNISSGSKNGTGTYVFFDGINASSKTIKGVFRIPSDQSIFEAGQVWEAQVFINVTYPYSSDRSDWVFHAFEEEGELKILKRHATYEIWYNGLNESGMSVFVYYKGFLFED